MKVLFLFQNNEWLGIEYLSSVLKQAGHKTDLFFDPGLGSVEFKLKGLEQLVQRRLLRNLNNKIKNFSPEIIAFSCLTNLYPWVSKMAAIIKGQFDIPIIAGGMHPTFFPDVVISNPNIDIICRGEGEDPFLELLDCMKNGKDYFGIKNLWIKDNDRIIKNEIRPLIEDLDTLPFPDKDLFYQYRCFSDRVYIMTSRGCPFNCSYCFNHSIRNLYKGKGNYVRRRKVPAVIEELKLYKRKYKMREVYFYDDVFTINIDWLREFRDMYKREINLPFKCNVRANCISKEAVDLLKDAGCTYVDLGVESGSDKIRNKVLNRKMTDDRILQASKHLRTAGIKINSLNIFGSPLETPEDMKATVDLNRRIKPTSVAANVLYPFPGTAVAELAIKEKYIDEEVMKKITNGEGASCREATILKHPYEKEVLRFHTFMPIVVQFPKVIGDIILRLPPWRIFRFISIFFTTAPGNLYIRAKEQLQPIWYILIKREK